jgi:sugar lactone lactonase YvrE
MTGTSPLGRAAAVIAVLALTPTAAAVAGAAAASAAVTRPGTGADPGGQPSRGAPAGPAGTISAVAGGVGGPGPGTTVSLEQYYEDSACGVSAAGNSLYVGDGLVLRKISESTGRLTTPAGTGVEFGLPGNGGPGPDALLQTCGAVTDHAGNLVIADSRNALVRVLAARTGTFYGQQMTAGDIYAVAGDGHSGFGGSGVAATQTALRNPQDVAVDRHGNLVIADSSYTKGAKGARLRVVAAVTGRFYGQKMIAGDIYTVAGYAQGTGFSGDGGPATKAGLGFYISAVLMDRAGNLVFADSYANRIRVVAASTGTFYGQAMTAGHIYTVAGGGSSLGDGGTATSAELDAPDGVAVDGAGNLAICDYTGGRVQVVAVSTGTFYGQAMTAGDIYKVAGHGRMQSSGDGGPATAAELNGPSGLAAGPTGTLALSDTTNQRVMVVAGSTGPRYGRPMAAGHIYTVAGDGKPGISGGGGRLGTKVSLANPKGVALDHADNLLIADLGGKRVEVVAAATGTFYGRAMTAGHIYTVAGGGGKTGSSGNGVPATRAKLKLPDAVSVDSAGNVLIADPGTDRVRVVAGSTGMFYSQPMTAGDIYTVAGDGTRGFSGDGGPATSAELANPESATVDAHGNLVIADDGNNRVRVVAGSTGTFYGQPMTAGDIYTVAGDGTEGFSGDGGPATSATFVFPESAAVDAHGNLVIADTGNNRVRVVAGSTGTFYGQPMTAGDVYTVAGDGTIGYTGDGVPATSTGLNYPVDAVAGPAGQLLIADSENNRVRQVAGGTGPAEPAASPVWERILTGR